MTPMDVTTAEMAVQLIRYEFCARIGKHTVWEKAFTIEPIRNVADYVKFRRTIHLGPVRLGLVASPLSVFLRQPGVPHRPLSPVLKL